MFPFVPFAMDDPRSLTGNDDGTRSVHDVDDLSTIYADAAHVSNFYRRSFKYRSYLISVDVSDKYQIIFAKDSAIYIPLLIAVLHVHK
ncbi:hypothetical protein I4U23_000732 [Adineta vaga]|nr:hypothetical protein I4U23_000732 [Adineta vaga]